jgi:hypothetical protein
MPREADQLLCFRRIAWAGTPLGPGHTLNGTVFWVLDLLARATSTENNRDKPHEYEHSLTAAKCMAIRDRFGSSERTPPNDFEERQPE